MGLSVAAVPEDRPELYLLEVEIDGAAEDGLRGCDRGVGSVCAITFAFSVRWKVSKVKALPSKGACPGVCTMHTSECATWSTHALTSLACGHTLKPVRMECRARREYARQSSCEEEDANAGGRPGAQRRNRSQPVHSTVLLTRHAGHRRVIVSQNRPHLARQDQASQEPPCISSHLPQTWSATWVALNICPSTYSLDAHALWRQPQQPPPPTQS
jgi:hypothetical protein